MKHRYRELSIFVVLSWMSFTGLTPTSSFSEEEPSQPSFDTSLYPDSLFHIHTQADAERARHQLIQWIWKSEALPKSSTSVTFTEHVTIPVAILKTDTISNLGRVDRIHVAMPHQDGYAYNFFSNTSFLLTPASRNNRLVIVHQGHSPNLIDNGLQETISALIEAGYSVLGMQMPLLGSNAVKDFPHHAWLGRHETEDFQPLKYFVGPINTTLNYVEKNYTLRDFSMIGISGGGWTTHIYSALDPRIKLSIPVAGSLPRYLRTPTTSSNKGHSKGDWEEGGSDISVDGRSFNTVREFMEKSASYLDLYILGAYGKGRKQVHVLNEFDSCCFSGTAYTSFEEAVKGKVSQLSKGDYGVVLDSSFKNDHKISEWAIRSIILPELTGSAPNQGKPRSTTKRKIQ